MIWIVLCIIATKLAPEEESLIDTGNASASVSAPAIGAPAEDAADEAEAAADEAVAEDVATLRRNGCRSERF